MKNILFSILMFLAFSLLLNAQTPQTIKSNTPKPVKRAKILERMDFEYQQRAFPNNYIPQDGRTKAIEEMQMIMHRKKKSPAYIQATTPEWECVGPFNVGGRIKSIAVHPVDPDIVYIAAAAGGIWKSVNAGIDWTPIFDFENAITFGALAIDPNNPDVIYAGTGEAVIGGGNIYFGSGLYKSTDAGETWALSGLTDVSAFSKIHVHPLNSNLVVAGAVLSKNGFYVSNDAGQTWERKLEENVTDVTINPQDPREYLLGINGKGIYYTGDQGDNWNVRNSGIPGSVRRVSVQMAPSNPDICYCLLEGNSNLGTIYKSTNRGGSWSVSRPANQDFFGTNNQGFYDNYIMINPENPDHVIAGGIDLWRTANGGSSWANASINSQTGNRYIHVDQQCGAYSASNPNIVFVGNDGGCYFSNDYGSNFLDRNEGLHVTQFYAMAIDNSVAVKNYGGTQDNGTLGNPNSEYWQAVFGGDGFEVIIHGEDPNIIFGEVYNGQVWQRDLSSGSARWMDEGIPNNDAGLWHSPFENDPYFNDVFLLGLHAIYASADYCESWFAITERSEYQYSSIAFNPKNTDIIWAGNNYGEVIVSDFGGMDWQKVHQNGLIKRYVTDIEGSYTDENTAYVTFSGYGTPHVFKTTDLGASWQNISYGLPDIPVNTIAINPENEDNLYVGTDIGVFATFDGGGSWLPFGRGLPRTVVKDLQFHMDRMVLPELTLRAATHGRSIWQIAVPDDVAFEPSITVPTGGETLYPEVHQLISWSGFDEPVKIEFTPDEGASWWPIAEEAYGTSLLWKVFQKITETARIRVTSVNSPSMTKTSNTFSIIPLDRGDAFTSFAVSYIPYGIAYQPQTRQLWVTDFGSNKLRVMNTYDFSVVKTLTLPGDSLYTDLTFYQPAERVILHRMNSTSGSGGKVVIIDYDGNFIEEFPSPASYYPIGIEMVDDELIIADRDGQRIVYTYDLNKREILDNNFNAYDKTYGPRGLAYDGEQFLYQICTYFPSGGSLDESVAISIHKDNLSNEIDRMDLEFKGDMINARGISYDPADENLWISDYNGNIYKIAGFTTIASADEELDYPNNLFEAELWPNPIKEYGTLSFSSLDLSGHLTIEVVDVLGSQSTRIFTENIHPGKIYSHNIDASRFLTGTYYLRFMLDGKQIANKKMLIIK